MEIGAILNIFSLILIIINSRKSKMTQTAEKFIRVIENIMRLSKQEALDGSYLNAIILLNNSIGDIRKKLKQGLVKGE